MRLKVFFSSSKLILGVRILSYLFVFIASLYLPRDPDLGWHLKYGEYIWQHHHILRENAFSTMMPHYHWANGSWGTDLITYTIFHFGGFLGLTLASAFVVTMTFFFFARAAKFGFLEEALFFPFFVYLLIPVNSFSFRGQQISLLLLGVLVFIISRYKPFSKLLWFVPVLFLFWSNLQIESFLGLGVFGLWIGFVGVQNFLKVKKLLTKENLFLGKVFLVTFFVTLINPFSFEIHLVALSHIGDPLLKKINEYVPFTIFSQQWWNHIIIFFIVIVGIIFLKSKKKLTDNLPLWGIPLILLLLTFDIRRYAWPAYYLTLPLFSIVSQPVLRLIKKYAVIIAYVISIISFIFIIVIKQPFTKFTTMSWGIYCQKTNRACSLESADYLKKHKLTQNLFSYYDWGGWLIWNYPGIKPSIDGRMHLWRDENGYSASAEYDLYQNATKSIDTSSYDVVYIPSERSPLYFQLSKLVSQKKWKVVYQDDLSLILVRMRENR